MKLKSAFIWVLAILTVLPFIAYGSGQFIPQYDGFIVTSGSMEPEIKIGSLLFTYKAPVDNIEVGDTITFREETGFTTHKVIEKNENEQTTFKTQGIANNSPDPGKLTEEQITGKKLFSIPFLGYVITWAGTNTGLIVLIIIPGTIIALAEIKRIIADVGN
jgi:signal peptidase